MGSCIKNSQKVILLNFNLQKIIKKYIYNRFI